MPPAAPAFAAPASLRFLSHPPKLAPSAPRRPLPRQRPRPRLIASAAPRAAHPDVSQTARLAPAAPGVYIFRDGAAPSARALYVGKARSLRARLRAYLGGGLAARTAALVRDARALELLPTESEAAALALEAGLVRELQPVYNVLLMDDRRHPYVLLTGGAFPRLVKTRRVVLRKGLGAARVYGPFVHEGRLNRVCEAIRRAYPLRQRATPLYSDRPCLNYGIGLCSGPCQGLVSKEEYAGMTRAVDKLLTGRVGEVLREIGEELQAAVAALDFERASVLRDRRDVLQAAFAAVGEDGQLGVVEEAAAAASMNDPAAASSKDVVACVVAEGEFSAKVALLQVRDGSVVNRLMFSAGVAAEVGGEGFAEEALAATLTEHYARAQHGMELPEEVVLATPLAAADAVVLADVLSAKRGKAVRVVPASAANGAIADVAVENAKLEVKLGESRARALRDELDSLHVLLAPYYPGTSFSSPFRIESYDISHIGGGHAVGSIAVLVDGAAVPREYRRIILGGHVSSPGAPDDYASIRETLLRRFRTGKEEDVLPDLIVIDGGKGQLSAAVDALAAVPAARNIPVVSLAKRIEEVFVPGEPAVINADVGVNSGVRLLCRARDEAHRNGVASTRRLHGKAALRSGLDGVPGVGAGKRDALLRHFPGGAAGVAVASIDELEATPGIGTSVARRIFEHFASFNKTNAE